MKIRLSDKKFRVRFSTIDKDNWLENKCCYLKLPPFLHFEFHCLDVTVDTMEIINGCITIHLKKDSFFSFLHNDVERYAFSVGDISVDIEKDYPCSHQDAKNDYTFTRP